MGRVALLFVVASLSLLGQLGCGTSATTSTSVTAPTDGRCQPSVTASTSSFGPDGGTGTLAVSVPRECSWSAASQAPWIAITSGAQGQGDGSVGYRVAENADPVPRQASLVVAERRVDVSQQPAPCRFAVEASASQVPPAGGTVTAQVRTHGTCAWTAASQGPWAQVAPASGRGEGIVTISVTPNPGAERLIQVLVAGVQVTVRQPALSSGPAEPPPGPVPSPSPNPTPDPVPAPDPPPVPDPDPVPVGPIDLEGEVRGLSGNCPAVSFWLGDRRIQATTSTNFRGGPCRRLRDGMEVEVEGMLMSDGTVRADRIDLDD